MSTAADVCPGFLTLARHARIVNHASVSAGKASMLINAGGSVALLLLFASMEPGTPPTVAVGIATAILYYMIGLLLGSMTSGISFMSLRWLQEKATRNKLRDAERVFQLMNAISTALIVGAWVLFFLGTLITYKCISMSPWFAN